MLPMVTITDEVSTLHQSFVSLYQSKFADIAFPEDYPEHNCIRLAGKTVADVLSLCNQEFVILKKLTPEYIARMMSEALFHHKETQSWFEGKPYPIKFQEYQRLLSIAIKDKYINFSTYALALAKFLFQQKIESSAAFKELSTQEFSEWVGYFTLIGSAALLNLAVFNQNADKNCQELCNHIEHDLTVFEMECSCSQNEALRQLKRQITENYLTLKQSLGDLKGDEPFCLQRLSFHVERKNQLAQKYGSAFHGEIILPQNQESSFYIPSPSAIQSLLEKISELCVLQQSWKRQFFVYYNHQQGNVDLLNCAYNYEKNTLTIQNIHTDNKDNHYLFVLMLQNGLTQLNCHSQLYACQLNLQSSHHCALIHFSLAGSLAKLPINRLTAANQQVSQPLFFNSGYPNGRTFDAPEAILWINPQEVVKKSKLKKLDDFAQRLKNRENNQTPSLESIQVTLKSLDNNVLMRRAAAGYGTMDDFDALIDAFSKLNLDDAHPFNACGKTEPHTPLNWALRKCHPKRAAKLIESGAKIDDSTQKIYQEACDKSSHLRNNTILKNIASK